MPVPSNPQDLINIIREKLFNNTSGLIEEPDLREVLENIVKVLDAKFSMFSPNLTEEQYAQWNLILDYMLRETKGVLTTSSPAPTGNAAIGKYLLSGAGTFTNLGGLVAAADKLNYAYFDGTTWSKVEVAMQSGKSAYEVAVANGFVGTEAEWLASLEPDPTKLPLYSAIKSANIVAGTQFIDDENGNVIYRVKTGQTLLTTEIPSTATTKVDVIISASKIKNEVHSSNGFVVGDRLYTYNRTTGVLTFPNLQTYYNADGKRYFVTGGSGIGSFRVTDFNVGDAADAVGIVRVIFADISIYPKSDDAVLQSVKLNELPQLADGKERIVFGYCNKVSFSSVVSYDFKSEMLGVYEESDIFKTKVQKSIEQSAQTPTDITTAKTVLKAEIHTSEGFVKNDKTAYSYNRTTGIFSNSALWSYYNANGIRYFITNPEGAGAFRITNFAVGDAADPIDTVRLIYADISVPSVGTILTLLSARASDLPAVPNGKDRVVFGYSLKVAANSYDLSLPMFGIYHQTTVYRTPAQIALEELEGVFPLKGWEWLAFGDSILEQANSYAEQAAPLVKMTLRKQGYGGCTMANHPSPLYAPFSMCNIVDNISSGDFTSLVTAANTLFTNAQDDNRPQVAALAAIDFTKINILTISYSTNDFGLSVPIGVNSDTTGATFKGAINKVITTLANKYPHIRIVLASPTFRSRITSGDGLNSDDNPNSIGKYIREYRDAMKELCDLHHVEFLDLQSKSGINKQTAATYLSDGLHPNNTGSLLLARKWAAFLNSNF